MKRAPLKSLIGPLMVIAVAVVIGNLVAFAVWTAPQWRARTGVVGGAGGVARARQRVEPSLQLARGTYGRLNQAETDLATFRERLVTAVGGAELLGMLDRAGDEVGIGLDDANLQYVPLDELGVVQLGITLPVTGTYKAVRLLLDELTAAPVFLVVDGVGLQTLGASAVPPPGAGGTEAVRVDLAISVFLDDPELVAAARPGPPAAARRPLVSERDTERLRQAARGDDPQDIADALIANLAALPVLPVDPASLVVKLDKLDVSPPTSPAAQRNLFAVVLPPAPAPVVVDRVEDLAPPPPILPVRLIGVLRIDGRWHASLADDFDVFVVAAGDSLPNGVRIVEVGADYTEVIFGTERTRLTLEGNRP